MITIEDSSNKRTRFSKYEISLLLDKGLTNTELATMLGRTVGSIASKRYKLRNRWAVKKSKQDYNRRYYKRSRVDAERRNLRWTETEKRMVLEHKVPDVILSKKLGRSVEAIQVQRSKLKKA